jgi:hypothetical protein
MHCIIVKQRKTIQETDLDLLSGIMKRLLVAYASKVKRRSTALSGKTQKAKLHSHLNFVKTKVLFNQFLNNVP